MADTGWVLCGTGQSTGTGQAWLNPGNITTASDASRASTEVYSTADTAYLRATNFGMTVPSGATITGVEARVRMQASGFEGPAYTDVRDSGVFLVVAGTATGSDKSNAAKWPGSYANRDYGGASDVWGATLTSESVNASNFGVQIRCHDSMSWGSLMYVTTIWMCVHYEEGGNFYERVAGTWRKGQLSERVSGVWRPGKLYERVGGIWRS